MTSTKSVILLSDKSSGSTIFQNELLKHPELNGIEFTNHNDHETQFWLKSAAILNRNPSCYYLNDIPYSRRNAKKALNNLLSLNDISQIEFVSEKSIFEAWDQISLKYSPLFFEKSPHHLNHWASTEFILRYALLNTENVKIIGLVRDPLSVIYSTYKRWHVNPMKRQFKWANTYQNLIIAEKMMPKQNYIRCSYEELTNDPQSGFKRICDFLAIDFDNSIGKDVHLNSVEKFKSDKSFKFQIEPSVRSIARYFGYEYEPYDPNYSPVFNVPFFKRLVARMKSTIKKI